MANKEIIYVGLEKEDLTLAIELLCQYRDYCRSKFHYGYALAPYDSACKNCGKIIEKLLLAKNSEVKRNDH